MTTKLNCFIDAEWGSSGTPLSLQVLLEGEHLRLKKYCVLHVKTGDVFRQVGIVPGFHPGFNTSIHFSQFKDSTNILTYLVEKFMRSHSLTSAPNFRVGIRGFELF